MINPAAITTRRPRCSPKNNPANTTVATNSRFNRIDAVDTSTRASPSTSSAGPTAPPATTATANGPHPSRSAARLG